MCNKTKGIYSSAPGCRCMGKLPSMHWDNRFKDINLVLLCSCIVIVFYIVLHEVFTVSTLPLLLLWVNASDVWLIDEVFLCIDGPFAQSMWLPVNTKFVQTLTLQNIASTQGQALRKTTSQELRELESALSSETSFSFLNCLRTAVHDRMITTTSWKRTNNLEGSYIKPKSEAKMLMET